MNFTYLVNKPQLDGTKKLEVVSRAEWQRIVAENANDPHAEKRYFIYDWIIDANVQDCMVIEVSKSQYKEWNQERMAASRNRTWGKKFAKISMNDECVDEEGEKIDLQEMLPGSEAPETAVLESEWIQELREKLSAWHDWAPDFLTLYLNGYAKESALMIAQKYGISPQTARKRRSKFEEFTKLSLVQVSF